MLRSRTAVALSGRGCTGITFSAIRCNVDEYIRNDGQRKPDSAVEVIHKPGRIA
jgi:hypothetical protein